MIRDIILMYAVFLIVKIISSVILILFILYTLQFVKIATPRRRHVTEMKRIPQIRYMTIDKRLELQKCTWSVSM